VAIHLDLPGSDLLECLDRSPTREEALAPRDQVPPEKNEPKDDAYDLDDAKPRSVFGFGVIFHWISDLRKREAGTSRPPENIVTDNRLIRLRSAG
jgi:hypothetical protein